MRKVRKRKAHATRKRPGRRRAVAATPVTAAELRALKREVSRRAGTLRWNPEAEDVQKSVAQLVLTIVEFLRKLMAAQALRALMADTLGTYQGLARVNKARVVAGSIPGFEATRSEVAMLQFRATVVRADLDLAKATAQLRTLLGRPPEAPLEIVDALAIAGGERTADDVAAVESLALRSRPDLLSFQLAQARSVADLRLQEALGRVDYTVGAEYRRQQGISGRSNSLGFFFSAPLPLLSRNQGEIARAGAERDQAGQLIAARRAQVIADVRSAHHDYTVTRELVAGIERDLLVPAGRVRDISSYTYQAGGGTLLELLDAQRAFNETMQTYVDAQANLRRAIARLNAAAGTEVVR